MVALRNKLDPVKPKSPKKNKMASHGGSSASTSPPGLGKRKKRKATGSSPQKKSNNKRRKETRRVNLTREAGKVNPKDRDQAKKYVKFRLDLELYLDENESKSVEEAEPFAKQNKTRILGFYNFKGGVGKTSNLINTAAQLAAQKQRVLVIDADPQCNLTNFYRPPSAADDVTDDETVDGEDSTEDQGDDGTSADDSDDEEGDVRVLDPLSLHEASQRYGIALDILNKKPEDGIKNLHELLNPAFKGDMSGLRPAVKLAAAPMPFVDEPSRIFYISGSPLISEFESSLSLTAAQPKTSCMYFGAFRKLLIDTAQLHDIDFVLVDFGPSVSTMNMVFLLSCDYILPPLFADYFSLSSMDVLLTHVIPSLLRQKEVIRGNEEKHLDAKQKMLGYAFNPSLPKILPFLVTNFAMHHNKALQIQPGRFVSAMQELVQSGSIPKTVVELFVCDKGHMVTPHCQDLQQLQHLSHDHGLAASVWDEDVLKAAMDAQKKQQQKGRFGQQNGQQRTQTYKKYAEHARKRYKHLARFIMTVCNP
ncbi:Chromosome partitioning protein ParA [Hondaea fermentalgiana]|uniref:Chromosome partitioning protein ParA n=1 Tax=Hondaea fermentalgiana TaxID=2315210 RepID=A0A2R5GH68_9STRA|nr:Chromosome partitioning protein ParA [Hondaea fermentalgiana]|eukprot:GBG30230.1 Chromosome partitioning protein ParA [Hondaea fermentalgiana]